MVEVTVKLLRHFEIPGELGMLAESGLLAGIRSGCSYKVEMDTEGWIDIAEHGENGRIFFLVNDEDKPDPARKDQRFRAIILAEDKILMRTSPVFACADEAMEAAQAILVSAVQRYSKLLGRSGVS